MNTAINTELSRPPEAENRSGKLLAASILGLPIIIVMVTSFMYFNNWMTPSGRVNHGLLLTPVIQVDQLTTTPAPEIAIDKWQLILRVEGACDSSCENWVKDLRQLHVALGKFESRVSRLYLSDQEAPEVVNEIGYYRIITGSLRPLSELSDELSMESKSKISGNTSILIADPLGNTMLHYDQTTNPKDIITDIKKMLKLSMIG